MRQSPTLISRRAFHLWLTATSGTALFGCSSSDDGPPPEDLPVVREPIVLPALTAVMLTTERTVVPGRAISVPADARNPIDPDSQAAYLAEGFGDYSFGPGEPVVDHMPDGSAPPSPGGNRRRLVRFIYTTDVHIADDESPIRLASFDTASHPTDGAARPQHAYSGRILNAAVRTVNALHAADPIDFVLVGGDVTDSAQRNEITWFLEVLGGAASVTCDSGEANDPVSGSNNDPKDPFVADGLQVPFYFCMGNHDVEIIGTSAITAIGVEKATGDTAQTGARDWSEPGGPISKGEIPADENRRPLVRTEMVPAIAAHGDGHGLAGLVDPNRVNYVLDVEGTDLRFVVYDTADETGGGLADGVVRRSDLDGFLRTALDASVTDGKLVVLVSHHPNRSLQDPEAGDTTVVPRAEVETLFASYANVIVSIAGHTHEHSIRWVSSGTDGYWEVQTSALIEYPSQMRLVEISDEDNGHMSIQLIGVDFATDGDDVAEEGRRMAILDLTAGWGHGGVGRLEDRNVKLWVPKPA